MKVIFVLTAFLIFQNSAVFGAGCPSNFPSGIICNITDFENWSHDYTYNCLYTAWPKTEDEVLKLANWALDNKYTMRASGLMHGYSPLTVEDNQKFCGPLIPFLFPICTCTQPPKILLVKTLQLTQMKVISNTPGNSSFWTQPGITLSTVLENLEKFGLGMLNVPSIGSITIGGAFTVGGHGTGVRTKNSNPPLDPGHTYGSISNLIMEVRVVAYDSAKSQFVLKTIPRTDPAMQGMLVHLGRTFVTNYTVRAGPLLNMSCRSYLNIPASELFVHPDNSTNKRTIASYLDETGIVETILFTFTDYPWTKVWEIAPTQPVGSRRVTTTNNYPFVDTFPDPVSNLIQAASNIIPVPALTAAASGKTEYEATKLGLVGNSNLWGTSRTVLLYVNDPLRWTEDGNGILTTRGNVQLVVNTVYVLYQKILKEYPIFGPFQIRVTGVDNPADVLIPGAQVAGMGPASPSTQNPEFDTVVWVNFLTFVKTQTYISFMAAMEGELIAKFKPPLALLRTEWSKAWGFDTVKNQAAANESVIKNVLLPNQRNFADAKTALNNMDPPPFLFSDPALNLIFK